MARSEGGCDRTPVPGTLQVMHVLLWFGGLSFEFWLDMVHAPEREQRGACAYKYKKINTQLSYNIS